jgi:hypothetical protein
MMRAALIAGIAIGLATAAPAARGAVRDRHDARDAAAHSPAAAATSDSTRQLYFYHDRHYGSEYLIDPARLVIAGGFGILQLDNRDNNLARVDYRNGVHNLFKNLAHPIKSITRAEGWRTFLGSEVLPFSLTPNRAYYWPNYTQHLVGGGMSSRMMEEWFRLHGSRHPRAWALVTMGVYHGLNEVVENDDIVGWRPDPVADVYIFNTTGIFLFSQDSVCRFCSNTLHLSDWSSQPIIVPPGPNLENSGQNFAVKYRLPFLRRTSLFYYFGSHGEGGLSCKRDNGDAISVAAGFRGGNFELVTNTINTVTLAASAGIFYDRDNSLLASFQFAATKDYRLRLNLYPGFVKVGRWSPGFVLAANRDHTIIAGIHVGGSPFVPVGIGMRR